MDRQYIDDHHVVARYLADQLPEPEREAFEAYYLEHPDMVREIEATARFKVGLAQLRDSGQLAALLKPTPWYARRLFLAVAAAAIVIIGMVFYVRTATPPLMAADVAALAGPSSIASSHVVLRRRGSVFDAEVTLPGAGEAIELRVLPEFAATDARYRISLARIIDDQREQISAVDHLPAGDDGMVTIYLNARRVAPGDYELTIASDQVTAADQTSHFHIRVRPASGQTG